jgi:hypothetical protein
MTTFTWTSPDPLNNKAVSRSIYITELQAAVNTRRTEISLTPITFIDQGIGRKFRLDAIEELKIVTNDLAILYGYPTGVQDPALLGRPYVTITKKYGKTVCPYPILNDLRVVLDKMVFLSLPKLTMVRITEGNGALIDDNNLINSEITAGPIEISWQRYHQLQLGSDKLSVDDEYLYTKRMLSLPPNLYTNLTKYNIGSSLAINSYNTQYLKSTDIVVDENYIYALHQDTRDTTFPTWDNLGNPDLVDTYHISRFDKITLAYIDTIATLPQHYTRSFANPALPSKFIWSDLTCDNNNIYFIGYFWGGWNTYIMGNSPPFGLVGKCSKTGGAVTWTTINEGILNPTDYYSLQLAGISMSSSGVFYTHYWESKIVPGISSVWNIASCILRITSAFSTTQLDLETDSRDITEGSYTYTTKHAGILTLSDSYLYILGHYPQTKVWKTTEDFGNPRYTIFNAGGAAIYSADNIDGQRVIISSAADADNIESYAARI